MNKNFLIFILIAFVVSFASPTHYFDGEWYTCNEYNYDTTGLLHYEKRGSRVTYYEYDEYNNKIYEYEEHSGHRTYEKTYINKYDSNGNLIYVKDSAYYYNNEFLSRKVSESWYSYNDKGLKIKSLTQEFNYHTYVFWEFKQLYKYNENGDMIWNEENSTYSDTTGKKRYYKGQYNYTYKYHSNGKISYIKVKDHISKYNENGDRIYVKNGKYVDYLKWFYIDNNHYECNVDKNGNPLIY